MEYRIIPTPKFKLVSVIKNEDGTELFQKVGIYDTEEAARRAIAEWQAHDEIVDAKEFAE